MSITLQEGASTPLTVRVLDASGNAVEAAVRFAAPRGALRVRDGSVQAFEAGSFEIVATAVMPAGLQGTPAALRIPVTIAWPDIASIVPNASALGLYVGTTVMHNPVAFHSDGTRRPNPAFTWRSSDPSVASVDAYGTVQGVSEGAVTITATGMTPVPPTE